MVIAASTISFRGNQKFPSFKGTFMAAFDSRFQDRGDTISGACLSERPVTVLPLKSEWRPVRPNQLGVTVSILAVLVSKAVSPENRTEAYGGRRQIVLLGRTCGVPPRRPGHLHTPKTKTKLYVPALHYH